MFEDKLNNLFDTIQKEYGALVKTGCIIVGSHIPMFSYEDACGFHVELDVPGVDKCDVDVQVVEQNVNVTAQRRKKDTCGGACIEVKEWTNEISYNKLSRTIPISKDYCIESCDCELRDGVLRLTFKKIVVPKKKIEVK